MKPDGSALGSAQPCHYEPSTKLSVMSSVSLNGLSLSNFGFELQNVFKFALAKVTTSLNSLLLLQKVTPIIAFLLIV